MAGYFLKSHSLCFKLQLCVFVCWSDSPEIQKIFEVTARGLEYGYDYWGNFGLALYTMFQVFTQEPPGPERNLGGGNSNMFYFHPYLGKIPILTNIFQRG